MMALHQSEIMMDNSFFAEMTELKRRLPQIEVDDSLSEWELARMTSKTLSMEQE